MSERSVRDDSETIVLNRPLSDLLSVKILIPKTEHAKSIPDE